MRHATVLLPTLILTLVSGCAALAGIDDLRLGDGGMTGATTDASVPDGMVRPDASPDAETDAGVDAGDAGRDGATGDASDGAPPDSGPPDSGPPDSGPPDAGPAPTYAIGGTLTGLADGETLRIQDNGGDTLTLTGGAADGPFVFPTKLKSGATYAVTVSSQPSSPVQTCTVTGGSGTVGSADVTNVAITCDGFGTTCPTGTVYTDSFVTRPTLRWMEMAGTWSWDATKNTYASLVATAPATPHGVTWIGSRASWQNYTVRVPVRIDATTSSGVGGLVFRAMDAGQVPAPNNAGSMYFVGISPTAVTVDLETGAYVNLKRGAVSCAIGQFYNLQVQASGSNILVSVDDSVVLNLTDANLPVGGIGLRTYNEQMTFGAVKVTCN